MPLLRAAAFVLALAAAYGLAGCSDPPPWTDRETLRGIQDEPAREKEGGNAPAPQTPAGAPEPAEIGVALPLTGPCAAWGAAVRAGANLAFADAGDSAPRPVVVDTGGTADGARKAVLDLASRPTVAAILGPCLSGETLAAAAAAEERGLPLLTPTATAFAVTAGRGFVFRACFTDPQQGAAMAIFAFRRTGVRRAAIAYAPADEYSRGLAESFEKGFRGLGGAVAFKAELGAGGGSEALQALASADPPPEAVFVPVYAEEAARFIVKAREAGYAGRFLGGDGWHAEEFFRLGGPAAEGACFSTHFLPDDPDPASKDFAQKFMAAHGRPPGPFEALGYDGARVVLSAVQRGAAGGRQGVRKALAETADFPGATGRITLDESGDPAKKCVIARVTASGPVFERSIGFGPGMR